MEPSIIVATIAAVAAITGAAISLANSRHIRKVEISVNGKLAALVEASERAARAEGQAEGRLVEAAAVAALGAVTSATTASEPQPSEMGSAVRVIVEGEMTE